MLSAHGIELSFGAHTLIHDLSFDLVPGDRLGLVGPNGCGKTTLLRVLAGETRPERGHVSRAASERIGVLAQGWDPDPELPLGEVLARVDGPPRDLLAELETLSARLAESPEDPALQARYDEVVAALAHPRPPDRLPSVLARLDLDQLDPDRPAATLSGGEKTRLALALLLLEEPAVLLLDEPTNHLDVAALSWLEDWLSAFDGTVVVASHDRTFLDRVCTRILAIDPLTCTARAYAGDYSTYREAVDTEQRKQWQAWREQEEEIRRVRRDIHRTKEQARHVEITTKPNQPSVRRLAKKVAKKAKSREKKLDRYLASEERVEKPGRSWDMLVDWGERRYLGRSVLTLDRLSVGFPGTAPLLAELDLRVDADARVAITGPNGSGKTSLLRTIAGELAPLAGQLRLGASVAAGMLAQEQETLDPDRSALAHVQAIAPQPETEARAFLHHFLFTGDAPLRPAGLLSYGERSRLALALLVAGGANLLLLDEPTNHLDIPSRERFEQALSGFEGAVLAVSHDRYFVERFATERWELADGRVRRVLSAAGRDS